MDGLTNSLDALLLDPSGASGVNPTPEMLETLLEVVKSDELDRAAKGTKLVAEFAKNADNRTVLGEGGLIEACCALIVRAGLHSVLIQAARAIGNMCFDHSENRRRVMQCNGAEALASVVTRTATCTDEGTAAFAMAGAGAVLNAATDSPELAASLVAEGVIENLLWLLTHAPTKQQAHISVSAISRFLEVDAALKRIAKAGGVSTLLNLVPDASADESDEIFDIVRAVVGVDDLLPELEHDGSIWTLLSMRENPDLPRKAATTAGLLLSAALSDDVCLGRVLERDGERLLNMFLSWIKQSGDDTDLAVTGALCIGNVARSDANCARLVANGEIIPALLSLMCPDITSTQHASLGSLKNLANFPLAKTAILAGLHTAAMLQALHSGHAHVQYLAASLLRSVLIGQESQLVDSVLLLPEILDRLVHLRGSEEPRVQAESARVLVNAVRFGSDATLRAVVDAGALPVFVGLLGSEHALLRTEAVVALVRCCGLGYATRTSLREAGGLESALGQLGNSANPLELLCSILALAAALLSDKDARGGEAGAALAAKIGELCDSENAMVHTQARAVRMAVLNP